MSSRHLIQLGYRQLLPGQPYWGRAALIPEPTLELIVWEEGEPMPLLVDGLKYSEAYHLIARALTIMKEAMDGEQGGATVGRAHGEGLPREPEG